MNIVRFLHLIAGEIWRGDILIADIEELEKMNASEIHPRRINAKEVLIPQRENNLEQEINPDFTNFARKFYLEISWICIDRGENLEKAIF